MPRACAQTGDRRRATGNRKPTHRAVAVSLLFLVVGASTTPALADAPPGSTADYVIRARLDTARHTVNAEETVRLTNRSARAIDSLTFHLYLNAFESDRTTWMRESGGEMRGSLLTDWGYIDVTSLRIGGVSRLAESRVDETLMHVPLSAPVPPGGVVEVEIAFLAKLPSAFARTGWARDFHMVAQWFPKLARLAPDGHFAARPYHATHEYDEDFGSYDVTVDVPTGWIVGATGERVDSERRGKRDVLRYRAEMVHDFAWTASPHFVERTTRAGPVRIRSLAYPGQDTAVARQLRATKEALVRFGEWLGPYPYPVLTVVSPPEDAAGAGGMEYPTLFTTGSMWPSIPGVRFTEEVAIHELGHQWFYGLLASNEPDEAWLDEGLNTWATGRLMEQMYGRRGTNVDFLGLRLGYGAISRAARALSPVREPIAQRSEDFAGTTAYGAHVYYGTDLLMRTLERRVGRARLREAIGAYAREYRFGHPTTEDVLALLQRELGEAPIRDLVRPALRQAARVDFAVHRITSEPVLEAEGYVRRGDERERVDDPPEATPRRYRTRVLVTKSGTIVTPVTVRVALEDGRTIRLPWDGTGRHRRFELESDVPAVSATVGAGLEVPMDDDLTNDGRTVSSGGTTANLWSRLLYVAQTILQLVGP